MWYNLIGQRCAAQKLEMDSCWQLLKLQWTSLLQPSWCIQWNKKIIKCMRTYIMMSVFTVQLHLMQCAVLLWEFCPSVLSNTCIVTKRNNRFCKCIHTVWKRNLSSFLTPSAVAGRGSLPPEILAEIVPPPFKKGRLWRCLLSVQATQHCASVIS